MESRDNTRALVEQVRSSVAAGTPLYIAGGDSKAFYGRNSEGERLDTRGHAGIVAYEPTELVITARAGTPLSVIEQALAEHGQMLPFDPPRFGGEESAGATLGVLLEVSLKVLPRPAADSTRILELSQPQALTAMRELAVGPAPLTGACHLRGRLYLRLSGNASGVEAWAQQIGGDGGEAGFWQQLRDQQLEFFHQEAPLWRLSLPPAVPHRRFEREALTDWGGAQRWLYTDRDAAELRQAVAEHGGHATLFRGGDRDGEVFQPLNPVLQRFHRGLKRTFDPHKLFNRGRLYADL
jgi:glycolate oxidase FAD binding subunit